MAKTEVAPAARATGIAIRPIEPTPVITTLFTLTPAAMTVCTALPSGSKIAAHFVRNRRIEPPDVVFRHRDVLGERSVAIDADDLDALADVRLAGAAEQAGEIGDVSLGRDAVAGAYRAHGVADGHDRPHELVPDDDRRLDARLRPLVPRIDVEIGAADAGLLDADQYVGRADRRHRHVGKEKPGPGPGLTSACIDEAMTARYSPDPAKPPRGG